MDHIDQAIKDIVHESSIKAKDIAASDGVITDREDSHCQRHLDDLEKTIEVMRAALRQSKAGQSNLKTVAK